MQAYSIFTALILSLAPSLSACALDQETRAKSTPTQVQGANLEERYRTALKQATAASKDAPFWVVYTFDVREGVGVDEPLPHGLENKITLNGLRVSLSAAKPSRNVGIFILQRGAEEIERVEIHDLDRFQRREQYAVKSLGHASGAESLQLLQRLYAKQAQAQIGERLVLAMAMHKDPQVETILKNIVTEARSTKERGTAAMWLGQIPAQREFLVSLATDAQAPIEVRKQAVVGLGFSSYQDALSTLRNIYGSTPSKEIKEQVIFAVSNVDNKAEALAFLNHVKENDPDPDIRRQARHWIENMDAASGS